MRRDRDTAESLLSLANALAEVRTRGDVAQLLGAAVPGVVGCTHVGVWLWDTDADCLCLAAQLPDEPRGGDLACRLLFASDLVETPGLISDPAPFMTMAESAVPAIRNVMEAEGLERCAFVPIIARGRFLGVVSAGSDCEDPEDEGGLLARLRGLADQAATALDNVDLLARLKHQALHDPLTGLPNRALLEDRAHQALLRLRRSGRHVSLLFIDLDRFKNVNDTLGHEVGDDLIREAGGRLARCLRATDTIARLGGDEFVALLADTDDAGDASIVADRMRLALRRPFTLRGRQVFISCSVGIATAPEHGRDYSTLLRHADGAMYTAKNAGGAASAVHAAVAGPSRHARLELEGELHNALERGELHLLYQPQIDLKTMRVIGVEALLRWDHPVFGRLSPDDFIPLAEESGLIGEIDEWVREVAFEQAGRWVGAGMPLRMAVNLSTRVLRDPRLAEQVAALLEHCDLSPDLVELEVTDRVVMADDELEAVLAPVREVGVRLAVDDFGTGTSVLGRLQRCHIDALKIDCSFVEAIDSDSDDAPVVSALLSIAKSLSQDVVAEGVETAAQGRFLRRHGCQFAQGFFFSPPVEPD
ncbi:MAG TPA: EAL domain-containing protein, partial [Acidimicrobiales bacterium]|nr:EAL domain-containing protein [Acidimicrobiales bacterium]